MSTLDVLLAVDAATSGNAQPRTTVRHRHISPAPMTIATYRMSGEAGAPLCVFYGTAEDEPTILIAPEPRNRTIRFREILNPLAAAITNWLANYEYTQPAEKNPEHQICTATPQILVPNRATAEFVGAVLGRSLRYLKSSDDYPVPDATILLGTHMTWFDQQSQVPGSCVLVAATDLLRRHWVTGQSALEDEDLHVLMGWIDPPKGKTGAKVARSIEDQRVAATLPSAGPTPDPLLDLQLAPLIEKFNKARSDDESPEAVDTYGQPILDFLTTAMQPTWDATWKAHRLLSRMPAGETVEQRWQNDRWAWTSHVERVTDERAFFSTGDSAKLAAWVLANFEKSQEALDRGEALDDPLVLAGLVANGEALLGQIEGVDLENKEPGKKRKVSRPLVTLLLDQPCPIPVGGTLAWADNPKVVAEIVTAAENSVTLKIVKGMTDFKKPEGHPTAGDQAVFASLQGGSPPKPRAPQDIPWTHIGAETPRPATEVAQ